MRYSFSSRDRRTAVRDRDVGKCLMTAALVERLNRQDALIANLERVVREQTELLADAEARFLTDHPQSLELSA